MSEKKKDQNYSDHVIELEDYILDQHVAEEMDEDYPLDEDFNDDDLDIDYEDYEEFDYDDLDDAFDIISGYKKVA